MPEPRRGLPPSEPWEHPDRSGPSGRGEIAAGLLAVTATYVSFLLWAQFGFLELLSARLPGGAPLRPVMAVMGVAGLLTSLGTAPVLARLERRASPAGGAGAARLPVVAGLVASAVAPLIGLGCRTLPAFAVAAALVGTSTGFLTVSLAARLRRLLPVRRLGLAVGTATGAAYLLCNLPGLFDAAPEVQAVVVAALCLLAAGLLGVAPRRRPGTDRGRGASTLPRSLYGPLGLAATTLSFLLLVGLDSAVFVIVQETPALKAATWSADGGTLLQGLIHLVAAVAGGALLDALGGRLFGLLLVATGALFAGGFALLETSVGAAATAGGALYAVGISLYSVALVVYPAGREDEAGPVPELVPALVRTRWRSACVYGLSGWLGSALGVGMAQDLHRIPRGLPLAVLGVLGGIWLGTRLGSGLWRRRPTAAGVAATWGPVLALAVPVLAMVLAPVPAPAGASGVGPGNPPPTVHTGTATGAADAVRRGRRVYVAEGCIHCHSQYVRPGSRDEVPWGPRRRDDPAGAGADGPTPPLLGVRRQGPDLSNVGNRRTAAWQRLHLIDPQALAPGSRMPSYAHLFGGDGRRGEDLVAYLQSLGRETRAARRRLIESAEVPTGEGSVARGRTLFGRVCAPCHGPEGRGDGPLAGAILRGLDEPGVDDGGDGGDAGDAAGAAEAARIMDLTKGAFWAVSWSGEEGARRPEPLEVSLARTIRFGIPGTPMPGHEVLTDRQVLDLVAYVKRLVLRPAPPAAGAGRG